MEIYHTSCKWDDISITNLLFSQNPSAGPKTLDIQLRNASQDNEGINDMFYNAVEYYQLTRDGCSALAFDSASHNETSWSLIKPYFRLAVPIFDPIHKIFNCIDKGCDDDGQFFNVKTWHQKSRNVFINSHPCILFCCAYIYIYIYIL